MKELYFEIQIEKLHFKDLRTEGKQLKDSNKQKSIYNPTPEVW